VPVQLPVRGTGVGAGAGSGVAAESAGGFPGFAPSGPKRAFSGPLSNQGLDEDFLKPWFNSRNHELTRRYCAPVWRLPRRGHDDVACARAHELRLVPRAPAMLIA
jgi:hypothetical protein